MSAAHDAISQGLSLDSDAAEKLTGVVTERMLNAYGGGGAKGAALVEAYRNKYGRGYLVMM